ncbi:uncharacterized protein LOC141660654 [Apium graveolens]|uniref:uncharacterized protein LOC141660654 n=1 Tax=Apium graveolens TaxID=4045 RepID=UPI003D7B8819
MTLPAASKSFDYDGAKFVTNNYSAILTNDNMKVDFHSDWTKEKKIGQLLILFKKIGYHEDHGHTTENCFSLKMFIEDQIKKGNINQYLQRRLNDKDRVPGSGKNVVNVVFGGTASPPRSPDPENDVMVIQTLEDEPICFSYSDYVGLDPEHNLALVVTLDVTNNEVKRILVDNGSSANTVFEHTLNRMELGHLRMDPCLEDPLYGFGNTMIPIWGVIYLPIIFGTAPQQVSHIVEEK